MPVLSWANELIELFILHGIHSHGIIDHLENVLIPSIIRPNPRIIPHFP